LGIFIPVPLAAIEETFAPAGIDQGGQSNEVGDGATSETTDAFNAGKSARSVSNGNSEEVLGADWADPFVEAEVDATTGEEIEPLSGISSTLDDALGLIASDPSKEFKEDESLPMPEAFGIATYLLRLLVVFAHRLLSLADCKITASLC
jgi:hypothetical protein